MAGRGPAPKTSGRRRANEPERGDWKPIIHIGWQHGDVPAAPDGLLEPTRTAWSTWLASWFASHWTPSDLPGLRQVIRLYDQVERGEFQRMTELRQLMDTYGITPKGQQDRRWLRPLAPDPPQEAPITKPPTRRGAAPYDHLQLVVNK
jgi:hypothetical protein